MMVTAVLGAAALLAVPSGAAAANRDYFGANVQPMVKLGVVPYQRWGTFLGAMSSNGLKVARADAAWAWVEPGAPANGAHAYRWSPAGAPARSLDRMVAALAASGIRWLPVISSAPAWAGGGRRQVTVAHFPDLAAFSAQLAHRYGPGGPFWQEHPEVPALPVQTFEVWTEGNSTNAWSGAADAADYADGLKRVAAAIHGASPGAKVLASLGWDGFAPYLNKLYADGIKGVIDGVAFHPYGFRAVDIIGLVQRMRASLTAAGDPTLPIYVTETGYPAYDSARDHERGATHALAAEALARSDCGVENYLMYANVGGETTTNPHEPIGEGFMGIYHLADATPNATGAALGVAARQWLNSPGGGIVLCGPGTTPAKKLLSIGMTVVHRSPTCTSVRMTYGGNPLEGGTVVMRTPRTIVGGNVTDGTGATGVCYPRRVDVPSNPYFEVHAELSGAATSATWACVVGPSPCVRLRSTTPVGPPVGPTTTTPASPDSACRYRLSAGILRAFNGRFTARARITCGAHHAPRLTVGIAVQPKGSPRAVSLGKVRAAGGRYATLTVKRQLRVGDRVVFLAGGTKGVPVLTRSQTVTRRLVSRR